MSDSAVRAAFEVQATWARTLGAAFTATLIETLAEVIDRTTVVGAQVLDWPGDPVADALVLRLLGGLNGLVRSRARPGLARAYPPNPLPYKDNFATELGLALADERLMPWLASPPQTNEVGRSAVLMAGLKVVAASTGLPLRLFELGASAGLNLRLDDYGYDLGGRIFGPPNAPLRLAPDWTGPPPPDAPVVVQTRAGVDLAPVDLACDADRLLAYVWPDQPERVARLEAAIGAFITDPVHIAQGDAAVWAEQVVTLQNQAVTVVFHSIAFQYFPAGTQSGVIDHLERLGAGATPHRPLAWLRFEMEPGPPALPTLRLKIWPDGGDRLLARAHPHGASVAWLA